MLKKHHRISTFSLADSATFFWVDSFLIVVSVLALLADFFSPLIRAVDAPILIAIAIAGLLPVIFNAVIGLFRRHLTIDLLASVALVFSLLAQEWRSAIFISLMLASARLFFRYTAGQAERSIQGLLKLRPAKVHLLLADGKSKEVGVAEIKAGDLILVEAGERIAVDGVVQSGQALVDQSSLTGESQPVSKNIGEEVFSSTMNVSGSLVVRATRVGGDTMFSKILELVEKSQASKAPIALTAEKFTSWYILATLILALTVYYLTHRLGLVLAVLLVTCADDLAVAIPLAFSVAIGALARRGIIVKGGSFIEGLNQAKTMVFDKTGTITEGRPKVQEVITFNDCSLEKFLALLGAAESGSAHPTAKAVQQYVAQKNIKVPPIAYIHEEPGFGIKGQVDGQEIIAGKTKFLKDSGVKFSSQELGLIEEQKKHGHTLTSLSEAGQALGFVAFSDAIRPAALSAIGEIKKLGVKRLMILTGDNEKIAAAVAGAVGISEWQANLLPQDKISFLKQLLNQKDKVVMVGDGVNDAAALALADIGVAMGLTGSDAAIESADIVLMKDDLANLPDAMNLGRFTKRIIKQDLWLWAVLNFTGLALVFGGLIGPSGAAAYNFLTDFVPLFNSLRIFRYKFPKLPS